MAQNGTSYEMVPTSQTTVTQVTNMDEQEAQLNRYDLATLDKDWFPILASKLSAKEPLKKARIFSEADQTDFAELPEDEIDRGTFNAKEFEEELRSMHR